MTDSLWVNTSDVDYMRNGGRGENASHRELIQRLDGLYGDAEFDLLDCGVMSAVTYTDLRDARLSVRYTGIDIGESVIDDCRARFPDARWRQMSVTDLSFSGGSFDVVNCRHVLEHLPYYETAVRELFRVSRRHVVICFFQPPGDPEVLLRRETENGYIWLNRYSPSLFEKLLDSLSSAVESIDLRYRSTVDRVYFCTK